MARLVRSGGAFHLNCSTDSHSSPLTAASRQLSGRLWNIRAPRVVLAALVGSTLSLAGASYQGVFRNPLVDPYLLGVAAGAGLGATVVITVNRAGSSSWIIDPLPLAAFIGGLVAVLVTYVVGSRVSGERTSTTLVLAGVAVTSLTTALQTFLLQRNSDVVRRSIHGFWDGCHRQPGAMFVWCCHMSFSVPLRSCSIGVYSMC